MCVGGVGGALRRVVIVVTLGKQFDLFSTDLSSQPGSISTQPGASTNDGPAAGQAGFPRPPSSLSLALRPSMPPAEASMHLSLSVQTTA